MRRKNRSGSSRAGHQLLWWLEVFYSAVRELHDAYWMEVSMEMAASLCRMEVLIEQLPALGAVYRPRIVGGPFSVFDHIVKRWGLPVPQGEAHPAYGIQSYAPFADIRTAKDYARRLVRLFVAMVNRESPDEVSPCRSAWEDTNDRGWVGRLFYALFLKPLDAVMERVSEETLWYTAIEDDRVFERRPVQMPPDVRLAHLLALAEERVHQQDHVGVA